MSALTEELAALEHDRWSRWMRYMLTNMTGENLARWRRLAETPYEQLPGFSKEADRREVDRTLEVLHRHDVDYCVCSEEALDWESISPREMVMPCDCGDLVLYVIHPSPNGCPGCSRLVQKNHRCKTVSSHQCEPSGEQKPWSEERCGDCTPPDNERHTECRRQVLALRHEIRTLRDLLEKR